MKMLIAAGEAVANAIEHGHRHSPDGTISLGATVASLAVAMTLPCSRAASVHRIAVRPDEIACSLNEGMRTVWR